MADATLSSAMDTFLTGGILTITQATANAGVMASTGYSLTGSNATSMIDLAGTWNTSGTPTAIKLNITDTASNASSLLMDLQVGSATKFKVSKAGTATIAEGQAYQYADGNYRTYKGSYQGAGAIFVACAGTDVFVAHQAGNVVCAGAYAFASSLSSAEDVFLYRDAAAVLALKNSTTAQTLRIYGNTTGSHYLNMTHNGTNAVLSVNGGGNLHISSLPTANPGAGILWNNAGTPAIGT